MDVFQGTITQSPLGGVVTLKRIPVRDGLMHTSEESIVLRVTINEFAVTAASRALKELGYVMDDRRVHGVGHGKAFFFDFHATINN
mgnify:CR=1 FL=1